MKKAYKVILCSLMTVLLLLLCTGCGSSDDGNDVNADYSSPAEAVQALREGTHIIGKTVKVKATESAEGGMIYSKYDSSLGADIYVSLTTPKGGAKKGQYVAVKIDSIEKQQEGKTYYIFGTQQ